MKIQKPIFLHTMYRNLLYGLLIGRFSATAGAVTITADSFVTLNGTTVTDVGVPSGGIVSTSAAGVPTGALTPGTYTASGNSTVSGQLNVSTLIDVQQDLLGHGTADPVSWDAAATVTWSETYSNSTASTQTWQFDFLIPQNSISTPTSELAGNLTSGMEVDITVDASTIWDSQASINNISGFSETGNSLGGTSVTIFDVEYYSWTDYFDSVSFTIDPFSSVTLKYLMRATTSGVLSVDDFASCPAIIGTPSCGLTPGIGDPFGASVILGVNVVPIPGAVWLMLSGLLALGGFVRVGPS
ncbi:MAG: VPLPA-CTERM sorting domain-containing protein [Gammaproteobacteria bacterium]